jgi:hypothetical protein
MKMKFIAFWEFEPEKVEKVSKLVEQRVSTGTAKRHNLMDPHFIGNTSEGFSGFTLFESDDQKEIASFVAQYTLAGMRIKVYPIFTMADTQPTVSGHG